MVPDDDVALPACPLSSPARRRPGPAARCRRRSRLIPQKIATLEELNLPEVLKELCARPKGLVLVTGPTGSGKSTTLAAMIDWINRTMSRHILTIEDPVEFVHNSRQSLNRHRH